MVIVMVDRSLDIARTAEPRPSSSPCVSRPVAFGSEISTVDAS